VEGVYRNPMSEVISFLETKHRQHYMVYNLCSERSYDPAKLKGRVQVFPFEDHNSPPLRMMIEFCKSVKDWFDEDPLNVAVIHCKAGKGRTGVMIAAYLLHTQFFTKADEALAYYGFARTNDCEGVTIASQRSYVHYYAELCRNPTQLARVRDKAGVYTLLRTRIVTLPVGMSKKDCGEFYLRIRQKVPSETSWTSKVGMISESSAEQLELGEEDMMGPPPPPKYKSKYKKTPEQPIAQPVLNSTNEVIGWKLVPSIDCEEPCPMPIQGDLRVECYQKAGRHDEKLFHFWFNASMLTQPKLVLRKWQLDGAAKDRKHKKLSPHFRVELYFSEGAPEGG